MWRRCAASRRNMAANIGISPFYRDAETLDMQVEDYADAHHLNGQGAGKFTAVLCDTAARRAAGEDVTALFFDTLAEKLQIAPDGTVGYTME